MPIIDPKRGVLVVRVVYDGAPMSGKTTSLRTLARGLGASVKTPEERDGRTLFFDWVDYIGGLFDGRQIRCQIVSVPGQTELAPRRRALLASADAVVLVADTRASCLHESFDVLRDLLPYCRSQQPPIGIVLQANKRDAPDSVSRERLRAQLDPIAPLAIVDTVATAGDGIREAFVFAVRLALDRVRAYAEAGQLPIGEPEVQDATELLERLKALSPPVTTLPAGVATAPCEGPSAPVALITSRVLPAAATAITPVAVFSPPVPAPIGTTAAMRSAAIAASPPSTTPIAFARAAGATLRPAGPLAATAVAHQAAPVAAAAPIEAPSTPAAPSVSAVFATPHAASAAEAPAARVAVPPQPPITPVPLRSTPAPDTAHPLAITLRPECDETPFVPDPLMPSGCIWPPVDGRVILHELAKLGAVPARTASGDFWVSERGFVFHSARTAIHADIDRGRRALIDWARLHATHGRRLSPGRAVILADAGRDRYRLWQLMRSEPTLRERIDAALAATPERVARELLQATAHLLQARETLHCDELRLPCTLSTLGASRDAPPRFVGLMPAPDSVPPREPTGLDLVARELSALLRTLQHQRSDFAAFVRAVLEVKQREPANVAATLIAQLVL